MANRLPQQLSWDMASKRWAEVLNPVIALPPNQGILLKNVSITSGANVINHKLGRLPQGYIITDLNAAASIYRSADSTDLYLTLTSDNAALIALWVF